MEGWWWRAGTTTSTDDAAPTVQSPPSTEEAPATVDEPATTTTTTTEPPGEYAELVMDYCEGFGRLDEPGGVDELIGMMTEDVVLTDTVLGGALTGTEMVRDYLTGEIFADIDTSLAGAAVQRGNWYAGTYALGSSELGTSWPRVGWRWGWAQGGDVWTTTRPGFPWTGPAYTSAG